MVIKIDSDLGSCAVFGLICQKFPSAEFTKLIGPDPRCKVTIRSGGKAILESPQHD
jgi:hypothetical protein